MEQILSMVGMGKGRKKNPTGVGKGFVDILRNNEIPLPSSQACCPSGKQSLGKLKN